MKERPILFSGPMVRAILQGCKTQTRRVVKPQPVSCGAGITPEHFAWVSYRNPQRLGFTLKELANLCSPFGQAGAQLWVKETHYLYGRWVKNGQTKTGRKRWKFKRLLSRVYFPGDDLDGIGPARKRTENGWHKRPSIFMPHWASRIRLEVASVRVERLNAISCEDAMAEGVDHYCPGVTAALRGESEADPREEYKTLWESINGAGSWTTNPWVWVVEFKRVEAPC